MSHGRTVLVLLATAVLAAGVIGVANAVTLSPSSGPAGTTISYTSDPNPNTGPEAVTVTLTDPNGAVVATDNTTTNADCIASGTITVPAGSPPGTYTLTLFSGPCEIDEAATFQVVAPTPPTTTTAPTTTTTPTEPAQPTQRRQRDRGGGQAEAQAAEPLTVTPSFTG